MTSHKVETVHGPVIGHAQPVVVGVIGQDVPARVRVCVHPIPDEVRQLLTDVRDALTRIEDRGDAAAPGAAGRPAVTADDRGYLQEVGMRVRVARVRRRISQDRLAKAAAVRRVSLGRIERGEHPAGLLTCRKLARVPGVPLGVLLTAERS